MWQKGKPKNRSRVLGYWDDGTQSVLFYKDGKFYRAPSFEMFAPDAWMYLPVYNAEREECKSAAFRKLTKTIFKDNEEAREVFDNLAEFLLGNCDIPYNDDVVKYLVEDSAKMVRLHHALVLERTTDPIELLRLIMGKLN